MADGVLRADEAARFVEHVAASGAAADDAGEAAAEESPELAEAVAEEGASEVKRATNRWRRDCRALMARARELVERRRELAWARATLTAQFLTRRSRLAAQVAMQQASVVEAWADGSGVLS